MLYALAPLRVSDNNSLLGAHNAHAHLRTLSLSAHLWGNHHVLYGAQVHLPSSLKIHNTSWTKINFHNMINIRVYTVSTHTQRIVYLERMNMLGQHISLGCERHTTQPEVRDSCASPQSGKIGTAVLCTPMPRYEQRHVCRAVVLEGGPARIAPRVLSRPHLARRAGARSTRQARPTTLRPHLMCHIRSRGQGAGLAASLTSRRSRCPRGGLAPCQASAEAPPQSQPPSAPF